MKYENLERVNELCKDIKHLNVILEDLHSNDLTIRININAATILKIELSDPLEINIIYGSNFIKSLINSYQIRLDKLHKELELL